MGTSNGFVVSATSMGICLGRDKLGIKVQSSEISKKWFILKKNIYQWIVMTNNISSLNNDRLATKNILVDKISKKFMIFNSDEIRDKNLNSMIKFGAFVLPTEMAWYGL